MIAGRDYETLRVEQVAPHVVQVTLSRPDRFNAMNPAMFEDLANVGLELTADDDVRAVVLTGAGKAFCAGGDLSNMEGLERWSTARIRRHQARGVAAMAAIRAIPVPIVAAVNGPATGGGLALALAADIRLAAPSARFAAAFTQLGLSAGQLGTSWLLPRLVGSGLSAELLLVGRTMEASEAERVGLVNRVVPADDLLAAALSMASDVAALPPEAVRATKADLVTNLETTTLVSAMDVESRTQTARLRDPEMHAALRELRERFAAKAASKKEQDS
ncbi:enoyl-CoA hydratase/isomerase family protein [Nocardioides sp. NPDC051685]|uniref:enoyl-CoA hydratase/isomerase family protein n=1 Tax=Nocardioides sp. NPDC051685 TaxID=3364334 RepID=UPI00379F28C6